MASMLMSACLYSFCPQLHLSARCAAVPAHSPRCILWQNWLSGHRTCPHDLKNNNQSDIHLGAILFLKQEVECVYRPHGVVCFCANHLWTVIVLWGCFRALRQIIELRVLLRMVQGLPMLVGCLPQQRHQEKKGGYCARYTQNFYHYRKRTPYS